MVDEIITLFWEDLHSSFLHRLVLASLDTSLFWKVKDLDLNVQCLRSFSVSKHPFQEDLPYTIMCAYIPKSVYYISNFCWMHFVNNPQTSTIFHVWSNLFWLLIFAKVWLGYNLLWWYLDLTPDPPTLIRFSLHRSLTSGAPTESWWPPRPRPRLSLPLWLWLAPVFALCRPPPPGARYFSLECFRPGALFRKFCLHGEYFLILFCFNWLPIVPIVLSDTT